VLCALILCPPAEAAVVRLGLNLPNPTETKYDFDHDGQMDLMIYQTVSQVLDPRYPPSWGTMVSGLNGLELLSEELPSTWQPLAVANGTRIDASLAGTWRRDVGVSFGLSRGESGRGHYSGSLEDQDQVTWGFRWKATGTDLTRQWSYGWVEMDLSYPTSDLQANQRYTAPSTLGQPWVRASFVNFNSLVSDVTPAPEPTALGLTGIIVMLFRRRSRS
jgi:hypothetical protein